MSLRGNLDSVNGETEVLELLLTRNSEAGTTLVLVTHDPQVAALAHREDRLAAMGWWLRIRRAKMLLRWLCRVVELDWRHGSLTWSRAAVIAGRDLRSAPGKFVFVVLSVAVGVAALVGVRGFSESFRRR